MDFDENIKEALDGLRAERDRVIQAIGVLEGIANGAGSNGTNGNVKPSGNAKAPAKRRAAAGTGFPGEAMAITAVKPRRKAVWTPAMRRAQSERLKAARAAKAQAASA